MLLCALPTAAADFTGYTAIETPEEMLALMGNPGAWAEKYYLTDDITLPEDSKQSPIGTSADAPFKGVFDGNGHTISGLALTGSHNVALFGVINGATIENLTVEGSVTATGNNVGGIIGLDQHCGANSTTRIVGCRNYGTVTATSSCTAGVLGYYFVAVPGTFEISQCANYGKVHGVAYTGGVIGAHINAGKADTYAIHSTLSELYNRGDVRGAAGTTGGVIGTFQTTGAAGSMNLCDLMHAGVSTSLAVVGKVNGSTPVTFARLYNSVGSSIVGTEADSIMLDSCVAAGEDTSVLTGDAWTRIKSDAMLTAFCDTIGQLEVVYLKDGGVGDGSSPEQACGTYTDAFEALDLSKDCTIVVCGPVTQTRAYNYGKEYTGSVTFTSVYDGVDYRESGAVLHVGEARFVCCGETRFENIDIDVTNNWWYLIAGHHPLTMGEGIRITGAKLTGGNFSKSVAILGGYQAGVNKPPLQDDSDVNITILSGRMYYIIPFNRGMAGTCLGTANIYIGGDAEIGTLHGSSEFDGSAVGKLKVTLTDNATIKSFYGGTADVTLESVEFNWLSGTIGDIFDWSCRYIPKKKLTIEGETVLIASEKAQRRSNFATIAAMFDKVEKAGETAPVVTKPEIKTDYGCAVGLYNLGLAQGYDATGTNFGLTDKMTRAQTVVQVIRFLGKEAEVKAGSYTHPFTDVPAWADKYIGYAYANKITAGVSATKFNPDGETTEAQFLTFMLRAVGYSDADGDFAWDTPYDLANRIGMTDSNAATATFLRGNAFRISWNALYATAKNGATVYNNLITAGVFASSDLDKAASAALSAKEPQKETPTEPDQPKVPEVVADPEGYNVISVEDYYSKTMLGYISNIVGVLTGYEHVYKNGVVQIALPDSWYKGLLRGPYAEPNENNKHEDKLTYNEETGLWEVWNDDDYSIDMLNQYIIRDSYNTYGKITSNAIKNAWVEYGMWDMGGGHRKNGAYGLSKNLGYLPPFTGRAEFGNLYSTIGESIIEDETLGMDAAGMPNVAIDLTSLFSDHTGDSDTNAWAKYLSAMYSMAYFEDDIPTLIRAAQKMLPEDGYEYKLVDASFDLYAKYSNDWRKAVLEADASLLREHYCRERMSENSINGVIMTLGLLYGGGDYEETCKIVGLAGHGGESTAACALGIVGVIKGWNNLEASAKSVINEQIWQDGKGVIVNLPVEGMSSAYWMHADNLPERIAIRDIIAMYQANFEKILLENGGKIENGNYYIPKYRIHEPLSILYADFEDGKLGSFTANGNAAIGENPYTGNYAAQVNGSAAAENAVYTTVSGLVVGKQYRVTAYINATANTTAHLFARVPGQTNYPCVSVCDPSRYVLRTFIFTATAQTMEIGLSVPAGTSEFKYATFDDFLLEYVEETVESPVVTMATSKTDKASGIVEISIAGSAASGTGREVYLKVSFANTSGATLNVPMTLNGAAYATIPFYKTGSTVYANACDATYIPIVLRGETTAVTLDLGETGMYLTSAEIVTIRDRW